MSISFYIKNKKGLIGYEKPMKVWQCLEVPGYDVDQFSFDEDAEDFNEKKFLKSSIADYDSLSLGGYLITSRGFELSFDKELNQYSVRLATPSTKEDWGRALYYIEKLAEKMGSDITNERGEHFTVESIRKYDCEEDILSGLRLCIERYNLEKDDDGFITFGHIREVALNKELIEGFLASEKPVKAFSKFYRDVQWKYLDASPAEQRFFGHKETGEVKGVYALYQNEKTILPFKPFVELKNIEITTNEEVKSWEIAFFVSDGDPDAPDSYPFAGEMKYSDFIEKLPKEKYKFIDALYIVVKKFKKREILALLKE